MKVVHANLAIAALAGVILSAASGPATAATISWGPAFELASVSDLDLTGANIQAANGGNDVGVMVGGVAFDNYTSPAFGAVTGEPAWLSSVTTDGVLNSFSQADFDVYATATGDTGLDTILAAHTYNIGPLALVTYTLSGLTVGQSYQLQIVGQADDRGSCCDDYLTNVDGGDGGGGVTTHRFVDLDGDSVKHVSSAIGTFTADATTQDFTTIGQTTTGLPTTDANLWQGHGGFSALVLSEVRTAEIPEPASVCLLCLGGLSLLAIRRRQ